MEDRERCRIHQYIERRLASGMECIFTGCIEGISGEI
jgi:hypothetical protein